jgi:mannose-1-phosphate guanylyltransferase / mannose-6-phosphate isomerase
MTRGGDKDDLVYPVILSGGSGMRLWPMSRALYPKQLLELHGESTMLQETAQRVAGAQFAAPTVICNEEHRFIVAEQLRAVDLAPARIILEPVGRNTAPAAAAAALHLAATDPDALMLVLPSDHVMAKTEAFLDGVRAACRAARDGALVTFGVTPDAPETGFGYIRRGKAWEGAAGCFHVESFVEKPNRETAKTFLESGDYAWNSGAFLFKAQRYVDELHRLSPKMVDACRRAVVGGVSDLDFFRLEVDAFNACPAESIDYAVMEKTTAAAVVPVDIGWSDVGSWEALWKIGAKDEDGNVVSGDVLLKDVRNSLIRGEGPLVAVLGVEDMIVIVTDDAVLATTRDRAQDVKALAETLKKQGRDEHRTHTTVYRPWGHYQSVDAGDGFQVKHIMVKPGAQLSLQMHRQRAEHWVVVAGTAKVIRGDETLVIEENQSTFIPVGMKHRLENPGEVPLRVIEVQSGGYLGEDDIVRFDDVYGRD